MQNKLLSRYKAIDILNAEFVEALVYRPAITTAESMAVIIKTFHLLVKVKISTTYLAIPTYLFYATKLQAVLHVSAGACMHASKL